MKPRIEMDDEFQRRPELRDAVTHAAAYLDTQTGTLPPPTEIRWSLRPLDCSSVELSMVDESDTGPVAVSRTFPVRHLVDPVDRDIWMLRVWRDLLAERSARIRARIVQRIERLERENRIIEESGEVVGSSSI